MLKGWKIRVMRFNLRARENSNCVVIVKAEIDRGQPKVSVRVLFYRAYRWFTVSRSSESQCYTRSIITDRKAIGGWRVAQMPTIMAVNILKSITEP